MKQKTQTQIFFDEIIKDIHQKLKPLGFKKKNLNFYRQLSSFQHYINIQKSTYSSADALMFTMNIGVDFSTDTIENFTNKQSFRIWERIGYIVGNSDIWYELDGEILDIFRRKQKMNETKAEVLAHIDAVLDFFNTINSEEKIENYW